MASPKPKTKLTFQDYLETPDDDRYELVDGDLMVAPSPNESNQIICLRLGSTLHTFVEQQELGQVFIVPFDVKLSDTDVVQPELLFVSNERAGIRSADNIQGAPDLVVEIQSPSTAKRDWNDKRSLYAHHGVTEYWLINPDAHTVIVLLLNQGEYEPAGLYGQGSTLISPTVEGFSVPVDEIFPS